jgi:hypothetical protein
MAVKLLKLMTGETVVSNVTPTPEGRMKLSMPVTLRMYPPKIAGAEPSLGFAPFPEMADLDYPEPILLEPLHVVYSCVPDKQLISEYNAMVKDVGAGATSGIITG